MVGTVETPYTEHIFEVSKKPQFINEGKKKYFHKMALKLLFLTKIAGYYI